MSSRGPRNAVASLTNETDIRPQAFKKTLPSAGVLAFAALAVAAPAQAHSGTGLPGGFASGFLHPLTGWDHLLAMVSVGLWGAILGRPLVVALPVIFPCMMVIGALLGIMHVPMPPVEIGIAASVLILGLVIALAYRAPTWLACGIVAVFAVFHGYAHGHELPSAADPVGYSAGFVLSTGLLHLCGIAIGLINEIDRGAFRGRYFVRGLGVIVTLAGGVFAWQALT